MVAFQKLYRCYWSEEVILAKLCYPTVNDPNKLIYERIYFLEKRRRLFISFLHFYFRLTEGRVLNSGPKKLNLRHLHPPLHRRPRPQFL